MKPSKRPGGGGRRPGHGKKKPWRRPERRPTHNGLDNTGHDESIYATEEDEEEEYFDDFDETDYIEGSEEEKDFQGFAGGDIFGLDTEEEEEEDNLQSLLPLSSGQPSMSSHTSPPIGVTDDSPSLMARMDRIEEIFNALHISSPGCKSRLICHLAKDPSTFTPLSHLLLDNLDLEGLEQEGNLGRAGEGLREEFLELLQAREAGGHRRCYQYSDKCSYKGEDMISATGLRAWRIMYRVLTMKALARKDGRVF